MSIITFFNRKYRYNEIHVTVMWFVKRVRTLCKSKRTTNIANNFRTKSVIIFINAAILSGVICYIYNIKKTMFRQMLFSLIF